MDPIEEDKEIDGNDASCAEVHQGNHEALHGGRDQAAGHLAEALLDCIVALLVVSLEKLAALDGILSLFCGHNKFRIVTAINIVVSRVALTLKSFIS